MIAAPAQTNITRILVFTMRKDLRLTRICIASIRYWYPDLRIDLVKDEAKGRFSTREIEEQWHVGIERFGRERLGGSGMLTKLEPLFLAEHEKVLLLDSDTIFVGPVIDKLNGRAAQFIVSEDRAHGDLRNDYGLGIVASFLFDLRKLRELVPEFEFNHRMFNAGHIAITGGVLDVAVVESFIDRGPPPRFRIGGIFQMGDQGFWNFLIGWLSQKRALSMEYLDFATYPSSVKPDLVSVRTLMERNANTPLIVHWAGSHHSGCLGTMERGDLLEFFENYYYSKVPVGVLKKRYRAILFFIRWTLVACRNSFKRVWRSLPQFSNASERNLGSGHKE